MKHVLDGRTMMLMKTIIRMKDHFYPCAVSACVCAQFTTDFRKKYFFEIKKVYFLFWKFPEKNTFFAKNFNIFQNIDFFYFGIYYPYTYSYKPTLLLLS